MIRLLSLLVVLLFFFQLNLLTSADVEVYEMDASGTPKKTNKYDPPAKGMSADELSPDMIRNLKASIPEMKAAEGVELPEGFDFQKMIFEQLEKAEKGKTGGGSSAGGSGAKKQDSSKSVKLTLAELSRYDGSDPSLPLYVSIRKRIYDVSEGAQYYGEGAPFNYMAGKEVTRALATGCFESNGLTSDVRGLESDQIAVIDRWQSYIKNHYKVAGWLKGVKISDSAPIPNDHCTEAEQYKGKEPV